METETAIRTLMDWPKVITKRTVKPKATMRETATQIRTAITKRTGFGKAIMRETETAIRKAKDSRQSAA